ncbi:hypothetical protein [Aminipila sp.]|uniref:hypothetical protein n=1 Tax=Aminipila sp. TaxID=2060095 RepID=UPI00289B9672|nr:hypothetical protein [Aminipila sp.]
MKKFTVFLLIGSLIAALLLSGCGSSEVKELEEPLADSDTIQFNGKELQYGQIISIDDNQLTITLGSIEAMQPPSDKEKTNTPESLTSSSVQAPPDGQTPPEKPDGENPSNAQRNNPTEKSTIVLTDQTLTLTIDDSTSIGYMDNQTSSAAISELNVGATIAIQLNEDGKTAKQILIIK